MAEGPRSRRQRRSPSPLSCSSLVLSEHPSATSPPRASVEQLSSRTFRAESCKTALTACVQTREPLAFPSACVNFPFLGFPPPAGLCHGAGAEHTLHSVACDGAGAEDAFLRAPFPQPLLLRALHPWASAPGYCPFI